MDKLEELTEVFKVFSDLTRRYSGLALEARAEARAVTSTMARAMDGNKNAQGPLVTGRMYLCMLDNIPDYRGLPLYRSWKLFPERIHLFVVYFYAIGPVVVNVRFK